MRFNGLQHVHNLDVEGYVNGKNITEYLSQIVYFDEDCVFHEEFIFEEPVSQVYNLPKLQVSLNNRNIWSL